MTATIRIALVLGITLAATSVQAGPKTLAECYDLVIAHCNTTAHPVPCSKNGMDQCDKEFKKIVVPPPQRTFGFTSGQ